MGCYHDEVSLGADHQPSEQDQIVSFEFPDLYHRSPDSGKLQCKARELITVI